MTVSNFILFKIDFREREGEERDKGRETERERQKERERQRDIDLLFHLCVHCLILVCALTRDLTCILGVSIIALTN